MSNIPQYGDMITEDGRATLEFHAFLEDLARLLDISTNTVFVVAAGTEGVGVWDDLRFPVQGINPPGAVSDPDVENTTGLLLFSASSTELIAGVAQMPHEWKEGSAVIPHVHWQKTTSASGNVLWRLEYEVVNNGETALMTYADSLDISSTVAGIPDADTANQALISSFGEIDMTDYRISSLIFWKLSRVGGDASDTYGADARLLELDFHYKADSLGSVQEFIK